MGRAINLENISYILLEEVEKAYPNNSPKTETIGQKAMDFLSDYPLYASTDGISYQEAIATALLYGFQLGEKNEAK